ncbi:hypothetical protein HDU82_006831 [Entophlyctis luteolus]|nr:hypothetical protein HDU82_006831 [Entophlyctis luteolus]
MWLCWASWQTVANEPSGISEKGKGSDRRDRRELQKLVTVTAAQYQMLPYASGAGEGADADDDAAPSLSSSSSSESASIFSSPPSTRPTSPQYSASADYAPTISADDATRQSASATVRAAERAQFAYARSRAAATAAAESARAAAALHGLEQETPLVHPWRRVRAQIVALGVNRRLAHNHRRRRAARNRQHGGAKSDEPAASAATLPKDASSLAHARAKPTNMLAEIARVRAAALTGRGGSTNALYASKRNGLFGSQSIAALAASSTEDEAEEDQDAADKTHILQITIPHGFQLVRNLIQPKPCVKTVLNTSSGNTDSFAVLDAYHAQMLRGTMRVAQISVGEEKGIPASHLTGLSRWVFIEKYRITVIATLHLELKILGLSLECLSQTHSFKPVLSLCYQPEREEVIAGGAGNIRIWTLAFTKGTYRLTGPRLVIDDLSNEDWISIAVVNRFLNKLIVSCDCDLLVYDYNNGKRLDRFRNVHDLSVSAMVFLESHQYLITASKDSTIKVWTRTTSFVLELRPQINSPVTGLAIVNPNEPECARQPLLLSSYQDGAIRMWNLENGTCLYVHQQLRESLGLGWLRQDTFFNYTRDRICVWNLNRKYSAFSTITSTVTHVRRIHVPESCVPPRILAVSDDAAVKLLSPVTGATLFTAFPVMRDVAVKDVEYDVVSNMLWVLTTTGEVFVYSTLCNPCKVIDEWAISVKKEMVTCMTSLRVAPRNGKRSMTNIKIPAIYTLLGGTDAGQVVTMDVRKVGGEILVLAQAHTSMISAIACSSEKMQLITTGYDGLIKLWSIGWTEKMDTASKDAENPDLCLQLFQFSTSGAPVQIPKGYATMIGLNPGSETVAFGSNTAQMSIFSWDDNGIGEDQFRRRHPADEDHFHPVSSISAHTDIKLYATGSSDGSAKIWDADADALVREIQFNEPVAAVAFCNSRADLLVSLSASRQLVLVRAPDFLPSAFLADLLVKGDSAAAAAVATDDPIESPKMFDSALDFWELYRIGLEKIGADLSKWHVQFQRRNLDEDRMAAQIEELERKKHDVDEQRKRIARQEKKRRRQLRHMTLEEQRRLLQSLGLLNSLKTIDLIDLMRNRHRTVDIKIDLRSLDAFLDSKIAEEKKEKEQRALEIERERQASVFSNFSSPVKKQSKKIYESHFRKKSTLEPPPEEAEDQSSSQKRMNRKQQAQRGKDQEQQEHSQGRVPAGQKQQQATFRKTARAPTATDAKESAEAAAMAAAAEAKKKTARLALVSRAASELHAKRDTKPLFAGKSPQWVQSHFRQFGMLPKSVVAGTIETEAERVARIQRQAEAAAAESALQQQQALMANTTAMLNRVRAVAKAAHAQKPAFINNNNGVAAHSPERTNLLAFLGDLDNDDVPSRRQSSVEVQPVDAQVLDLEEAEKIRLAAEESDRLKRLEEEDAERKREELNKKQVEEQRLRDAEEFKKRKEEEARLLRERLEAEETEKRRIREENEAKRKAELEAKHAEKRAKKEALAAIMASRKAEAEEAARLKQLEIESCPEGESYKELEDSIKDNENSDDDGYSSGENYNLELLGNRWNDSGELTEISKNAWSLIATSKQMEEHAQEKVKPIFNYHWFPGLNGKEVNLKNILAVLFGVMKNGYWREKSEACKAVLYLPMNLMLNGKQMQFRTFEKDFITPFETVIQPQLEFFNDTDWQLRATLCAVMPAYKTTHHNVLFHLICSLTDQSLQVRRIALKALCEIGIDSREALRQAMVTIGMLSSSALFATKNSELLSLDDELGKMKARETERIEATNRFISDWQSAVPKKKMPGVKKNRPDSFNATLVKKGVLTKEDAHKLLQMEEPQGVACAVEEIQLQKTEENTESASIIETAKNNTKIRSVQPVRRESENTFHHMKRTQSLVFRAAEYRRRSFARWEQLSAKKLRHQNQEIDSGSEKSNENVLTRHDPKSQQASARTSVILERNRRKSSAECSNEPADYSIDGSRRPSAASKQHAPQDVTSQGPSDQNMNASNAVKSHHVVRLEPIRPKTYFFDDPIQIPKTSPSKPVTAWRQVRSAVQTRSLPDQNGTSVDPWGIFTSKRRSLAESELFQGNTRSRHSSGPIMPSIAVSEEEELVEVDEGGIKIYSRRVSMQPDQMNYYRRINRMASTQEEVEVSSQVDLSAGRASADDFGAAQARGGLPVRTTVTGTPQSTLFEASRPLTTNAAEELKDIEQRAITKEVLDKNIGPKE